MLERVLNSLKIRPGCYLCGMIGALTPPDTLCTACLNELPKLAHACQTCALPLAVSAPRCGDCSNSRLFFDRASAGFVFSPLISHIIRRFKGKADNAATRTAMQLMASVQTPLAAQLYDIVVPMPLHWRRQWLRGFNQASLLAAALPLENTKLQLRLVTRVHQRADQKTSTRTQRQKNLAGAFKASHSFSGASVLIVDDVITTGASINELAQLMKARGATRVDAVCLARTPK